MGSDRGSIHGYAGAGIAGNHAEPRNSPLLVAPATASERNTMTARVIPVACWRVDDIRFHFGSSVVLPEIQAELQCLADLVQAHPDCPLSVFGHADPVGTDSYNKTLSGRRAKAIYAMLVRDAGLWEQLYSAPLGDDTWGGSALQMMASKVSPGSNASGYEGSAGARQQLFTQYMDQLCGPGLKLSKADFLARGADADGKGDYQGCSSFNPVLVFSKENEAGFDQDEDKSGRNAANAPNRRVMILLFRKGTVVDPSRWPCPRAAEGVAKCEARFWSDGEDRRHKRFDTDDRSYDASRNTFACRFYDRLTGSSPCHKIVRYFRVRLYDPTGKFLARARYRLTVGGTTLPEERADEEGRIVGRDVEVPTRCVVEWDYPPEVQQPYPPPNTADAEDSGEDPATESGEAVEYPFRLEVYLTLDGDNREKRAREMLNNLGYLDSLPLEDSIAGFQTDYGADCGLTITGELDDQTFNAIEDVHSKCADNLRTTPTAEGGA